MLRDNRLVSLLDLVRLLGKGRRRGMVRTAARRLAIQLRQDPIQVTMVLQIERLGELK